MPSARDANWIDGLRGIASFVIVTGHLCTAFIPWIHSPALGKNEPPHILQYPIFRLLVGGRTAVALFFLITGYVNAIGPLSKTKGGNIEAAYGSIARSALGRSGRLVLPTIIATTFSWFLAQTGAYGMAHHIDATWIRQGYIGREPTIAGAVQKLIHAEVTTWTTGWDEYDGTQWTLRLFLQGAFLVYMTLLATMQITPRARKLVLVALYIYSWLGSHPVKGMNIFFGIFIAELHTAYGSSAPTALPRVVPFLLILAGAFLSSYPQDSPEWTWWSEPMRVLMKSITPEKADIRRYWDSLGGCLILTGVFFCGSARRLLGTKWFNFLGRVSFPVYLLHNQLMKTLLTWMIYMPAWLRRRQLEQQDGYEGVDEASDDGSKDLVRGPALQFLVAIPLYYFILYRLAYLWTLYIDPLCAKLVDKATKWAVGDVQSEEKLNLLG